MPRPRLSHAENHDLWGYISLIKLPKKHGLPPCHYGLFLYQPTVYLCIICFYLLLKLHNVALARFMRKWRHSEINYFSKVQGRSLTDEPQHYLKLHEKKNIEKCPIKPYKYKNIPVMGTW